MCVLFRMMKTNSQLISLIMIYLYMYFFFFKQKTAYEMRISDWSSDVCSSDLVRRHARRHRRRHPFQARARAGRNRRPTVHVAAGAACRVVRRQFLPLVSEPLHDPRHQLSRSEEHTSELQSLMRISYAVFCLKKKKNKHHTTQSNQ